MSVTATLLDEPCSKRLLAETGIAVPRGVVLEAGVDVVTALAGLRFPLAAKLLSATVTHKSDVGGVRLGLRDAEEVARACAAIRDAVAAHGHLAERFLIEEMAPSGQEVVIGGLQDPRFGPVIMLGLGGIFVEVFADAAFRVCPIEERDARSMIGELRSAPLLRGTRGRPPVCEAALIAALLAIGGEGGLLLREPIAELDINPLIVSPGGAIACDCRILLAVPANG
jgi:acetyl-CoA synthetase (ADP-forming)